MPDPHKNFAYGTVLTAPSPATSGTSLVLGSGQGASFPAPSTDGAFSAVVWPAGAQPSSANAEIVRVTARSTDTPTIVRQQEGTSARTIVAGDQFALVPTAKVFDDLAGDVIMCAIPTGIAATDNANFQAGLTAAAGGTLQLRAGTYNLTTAMTVSSFTTIVGDQSTIVHCTVSGVMFNLASLLGITFRGMRFNLLGTSSTLFYVDGSFGITWDGVTAQGTHTQAAPQAAEIGIDMVNNSGDCWFIGGSELLNFGIGVRSASYALYMTDAKVSECQYGVYLVASFSSGIIITNCTFASTVGGTTISQVFAVGSAGRVQITGSDFEGATNTIQIGNGTLFNGTTTLVIINCSLAGTTKILDIQSSYSTTLVGLMFTADVGGATPTTLTINATGAPDNGYAMGLGTNVAADSDTIAASLFPPAWTYFGRVGNKLSGTLAMNSTKITSLANGSASSDAAAFGQIPVVATAVPIIDGTATIGASGKWADASHIHPTDTSRAALASPTFTGNPAAPTQSAGDNSTKLATTAYVDTASGLLIPKSLVTTKGDLIVATASATPARLAAGTNGLPLVADSAQSAGLKYAALTDSGVDAAAAIAQSKIATLVSDLAAKAPLASPTLTGTPVAPTPAASDYSTKLATTAYVDAAIAKRTRNQAWMPSGAISETYPRDNRSDACTLSTTGVLYLAGGGLLVPAGVTVTNITFVSSSTAANTPTNWWFCLVDQALNVIGKTADQLTAPWTANTPKTLALASTYTPSVDTPVYAGYMVKATTVPSFVGSVVTAGGIGVQNLTPRLSGQSTTGLTTPASLGATAAALGNSDLAYAYLS